jgi:hypothetical protein
MLQPLGSNLRDRVILVGLTGWDSGKLHGVTIAERTEQLVVNGLLEASGLLYIFNSKVKFIFIFYLPSMVPSRTPRSWVLWYLVMVGSA